MSLSTVDSAMDRTLSDFGVYVLAGAFALAVFVVALFTLSSRLAGGLDLRQVFGFGVGFLLFVGVYFTAWWIYTEIDAREGNPRE